MGSILCNYGRGTSQEGDRLGCWDIHKATQKPTHTVSIFCCTPMMGQMIQPKKTQTQSNPCPMAKPARLTHRSPGPMPVHVRPYLIKNQTPLTFCHESQVKTVNGYTHPNISYNSQLISTQPKQPLHPILYLCIHCCILICLGKTVTFSEF